MDESSLKQICDRLERSDQTLTLLNLSCRNVCSEGLIKMADTTEGQRRGPGESLQQQQQQQQQQQGDHNSTIARTSSEPTTTTTTTHLIALWLEGNEIYSSGAKALRRLVGCSPHLKYLYMSNNHIGDAGINALTSSSSDSSSSCVSTASCSLSSSSTGLFSQLSVFNVGDNDITHIGAHGIAEALAGRKINATPSSGSSTDETSTTITPTVESVTQGPLQTNTRPKDKATISTLILDNNQLGDKGLKFIAEALKYNTSLNHLDVRFNHITLNGLRVVRDVLKNKQNTTIQTFCFEEIDDYQQTTANGVSSCCRRRQPKKRHRSSRTTTNNCKVPRIVMEPKSECCCDWCEIRYEIDYYLAMNRSGLQSQNHLGDVKIPSGCWPKIMAKLTHEEPSVLYTILKDRPDVPSSSWQALRITTNSNGINDWRG